MIFVFKTSVATKVQIKKLKPLIDNLLGGWGPAIFANFPPIIWFLTVSILMIKKGKQ
jgi:hypothetical protein